MPEEESFNIFHSPPPKRRVEKQQQKETLPSLTDEEVEKMLQRMSDLHDELSDSLHAAFEQQGMSTDELARFLNDPTYFTEEQWKNIQEERKMQKEKLWEKIGKEKEEQMKLKKKKKKAKQMRGRTLGSRKKWLEM